MRSLSRQWLFALLICVATASPVAATDFRLALFYESGVDEPYAQVFRAASMESALQQAGPLGPDLTLRLSVDTYQPGTLRDCVKTRYAQPSRFPQMTPKDELLKALATLVAARAALSNPSATLDRARRLSKYLGVRWQLRRPVLDAVVVCYRQDPKYQTRSISYPVFYVLIPAFEKPVPVQARDVAKPVASLQDVLEIVRKTQARLASPVSPDGNTFTYYRTAADPVTLYTEPPEVILLSPTTGGPVPPTNVAAHAMVHELGHYLSLAHVNTSNLELARMGLPTSDHSVSRCASFVTFANNNTWSIKDGDELMSHVTDTATFFKEDPDMVIKTTAEATALEQCYNAQEQVLKAHGITRQLFRPESNVMSYGMAGGFFGNPEWSTSQIRIAKAKAQDLLRSASGP